MTKHISDAATKVLGTLHIEDGDGVVRGEITTGQLDRKVYVEVNAVLEMLGGKWNRKTRTHVFANVTRDDLETKLATIFSTRTVVDEKKLFQFYETPPEIAARLTETLCLKSGISILEPSAGRGALIQPLLARCSNLDITAIELNPANVTYLQAQMPEVTVRCADFLTYKVTRQFDRVVMNPPFNNQQDAKHVAHAYSMLKPGGELRAIMSPAITFRETAMYAFVRSLKPMVREIPAGAFKAAGTNIATMMVSIVKPS